jgi:hypothetical protein
MSNKRKKINIIITEYPIEKLYTSFKNHRRLGVFAQKGRKCVCCHIEGTRLIKHRIINRNRSYADHIDLYTKDLILMTVDHMLPKCKGGNEKFRNKQTMCYKCNQSKGGKYVPFLGGFSWFYRLEYLIKMFLNTNRKFKKIKRLCRRFVKNIKKKISHYLTMLIDFISYLRYNKNESEKKINESVLE